MSFPASAGSGAAFQGGLRRLRFWVQQILCDSLQSLRRLKPVTPTRVGSSRERSLRLSHFLAKGCGQFQPVTRLVDESVSARYESGVIVTRPPRSPSDKPARTRRSSAPEPNVTPPPEEDSVPDVLRAAFSENLKATRSEAGVSLRELSKLSGVALSHLFAIERRQANVTLDLVASLATALSVDPHRLLQPIVPSAPRKTK